MSLYVLDSSVATRFLLTEDLSKEAFEVLEALMGGLIQVAAPLLIIYETGNALWNAVRRNLIQSGDAVSKLDEFLGLGIPLVDLESDDYRDTLRWSISNSASYYDGAYVLTAQKLGATLLTADDALHSKAKGKTPVLHLKDFHSRHANT